MSIYMSIDRKQLNIHDILKGRINEFNSSKNVIVKDKVNVRQNKNIIKSTKPIPHKKNIHTSMNTHYNGGKNTNNIMVHFLKNKNTMYAPNKKLQQIQPLISLWEKSTRIKSKPKTIITKKSIISGGSKTCYQKFIQGKKIMKKMKPPKLFL